MSDHRFRPLAAPRRRQRFQAMTLAFAALVLSGPALGAEGGDADAIFLNGVIRTMASADELVEAVAVRKGHIVHVGDARSALALKGPGTQIVDLHGQAMLPGFIDAHGHISASASFADMANLSSPPVAGVTDIASLQARLREFAADHPVQDGEWLRGFGYDDSLLQEKRHPTRQELDAVSATRPIVILHVSGHLAVGNSVALERAGLLHDPRVSGNGVVHLESDGRTAAGLVEEAAVFRLLAAVPAEPMTRRIENLRRAQKTYASYGITTAQDGAISPDDWVMLHEAADRDALILDVGALLYYGANWPDLAKMPIGKPARHRLRILGIKLMLDGSPQGRTAWLREPYYRPPPGRGADYRGYPQLDDGLLRQWLTRAGRNNWQMFVHVNGDAAMQQLIDAVKDVDSTLSRPLERTIAIHSQVVGNDQLAAMRALDIQPSFFVTHSYYWGDWHRETTLGPDRADRISPMRDALAAGLRPTTHNDAPVVPPDMIRLVWSAATRRTRSNDILGPSQRVSTYEALVAITRDAAWQIHEDDLKGTIAVGKMADFVVLDRDPLAQDPERLLDLKITATYKDGRAIYRKPGE